MAASKQPTPTEKVYVSDRFPDLMLVLPKCGAIASFRGKKYRTADAAEQAEIEQLAEDGIAEVYEDDGVVVHRCPQCEYSHSSERAIQVHVRSAHK